MTNLERTQAALDSDAAYINDEKTIRWLSGFSYTDGFLFITRDTAYLICDSRYIEAARQYSPAGFSVIMPDGRMSDKLSELMKKHSVKSLGIEDERLFCHAFETLKKQNPDINFTYFSEALAKLRAVKQDFEIEKIISAQRIAEKAFEHILSFISPVKTEFEIALELETFMRKNGAEAVSFDTIAVSGAEGSKPHGVPRRVPVERGFLTMDFGAVFDGYCSDMTRTVCIGKADGKQRELYSVVLSAQRAAIEKAGAGIAGSELDKVARDIISSAGYGDKFGHGLGHGVGAEIHELPSVSPRSEAILEPGNIITVEPGIYLPGKCGLRIEDMLVITDNGHKNITFAPKELIEL